MYGGFAALFRKPPKPEPDRKKAKVHRNAAVSLDEKLDQGERIYGFLARHWGEEKAVECARHVLRTHLIECGRPAEDDADEKDSLMPYGFWQRYFKEVLNLKYSRTDSGKRKKMWGCLAVYLDRKGSSGKTRVAMRDGRKGASKRNSGSSLNAVKGVGLSFALLQWFVDEMGSLQARSDSEILLNKAREMRQWLIDHEEVEESDLPKLVDAAGRQWLRRWRLKYNISLKHHWDRLKVSWPKIKKRVEVLLTNIFRHCPPNRYSVFRRAPPPPPYKLQMCFSAAGMQDTRDQKGIIKQRPPQSPT